MVKIGNPPNYLIQVFPTYTDGDPRRAALYDGMYSVTLNGAMEVTFIPEAPLDTPPWPANQVPGEDSLTTPEQMRWYQLITGLCVVTPNAARAGRAELIGPADQPVPVFFVTPTEFATFGGELAGLEELTDGGPRPRRDEVLDRAVIRYIDRTVLESPLLDPMFRTIAGRTEPGR